MLPPLIFNLNLLSAIAKENQTGPVRCQGCYRITGIFRHGYYLRYLFDSNEMVQVQRYRCCNPDCDCLTFSILPHPFLRYIRLPLCFLLALLSAHESGKESLSSLARQTGLSRPRVKRAVLLAPRLVRWLDRVGLWPERGWPCLNPQKRWTDFIRVFSWSFFPGRYRGYEKHTN
jgi:hypothetical protein